MKYIAQRLVSALSLEPRPFLTPKRGPPCTASQCTPKILAALRRAIELDLLKEQAEEKVSLFGCDKAARYSDVAVSAGPLTVMKVEDQTQSVGTTMSYSPLKIHLTIAQRKYPGLPGTTHSRVGGKDPRMHFAEKHTTKCAGLRVEVRYGRFIGQKRSEPKTWRLR